jgi:hypothetical protein
MPKLLLTKVFSIVDRGICHFADECMSMRSTPCTLASHAGRGGHSIMIDNSVFVLQSILNLVLQK